MIMEILDSTTSQQLKKKCTKQLTEINKYINT